MNAKYTATMSPLNRLPWFQPTLVAPIARNQQKTTDVTGAIEDAAAVDTETGAAGGIAPAVPVWNASTARKMMSGVAITVSARRNVFTTQNAKGGDLSVCVAGWVSIMWRRNILRERMKTNDGWVGCSGQGRVDRNQKESLD
jgi:hypothetical protein